MMVRLGLVANYASIQTPGCTWLARLVCADSGQMHAIPFGVFTLAVTIDAQRHRVTNLGLGKHHVFTTTTAILDR